MAGYIPDRVLEEVRFRNDIVEVISAYVPLKRTGATYKACCPFHKEKTPSFNVNPNMQIFKCFGCGEAGDVISFVMKHQGLDFLQAVKVLAERVGIAVETEGEAGKAEHRRTLLAVHAGLAQFFVRCLDTYEGARVARDYVQQRQLTDEKARAFGIGYAPGGWDTTLRWGEKHGYDAATLQEAGVVLRKRDEEQDRYYDRFRDRLMFPIRDVQGRVVGFSGRLLADQPRQPKYVNSPETELFHKGRILFGLDLARQQILQMPEREALVVEGQVDVVRCHQFGFGRAVAAQGTAFTDEHVAILKRYADSAVMVYDADGAGQTAALKTAQALMRAGLIVRVAVLPPGDDPDSFLLREGEEAFAALLAKAGTAVAFQVAAMCPDASALQDLGVTTRIAKAVLETIACSPDAVQRSKLLQEAGRLLGVSESALEQDLAQQEAARAEQEQRQARFQKREEGARHAGSSSGAAEAPPPDQVAGAKGAPAGQKARAAGMPAAERLFVQLLAASPAGESVFEMARAHMSPGLLRHPVCRALTAMLLETERVAADATPDGEEEPPVQARARTWLVHLRAQPQSWMQSDQLAMGMQDTILKLWRTHLERERKVLMSKPDYASDPAVFERCIQIGHDLLTLRQWDTGQDVILAELAMQAEAAAGAAAVPTEPDLHAGDSEA